MTTTTINGRRFGLIEVPEGDKSFAEGEGRTLYVYSKQPFEATAKLHGLASDLSEEDWKGIVDRPLEPSQVYRWKDYTDSELYFVTATKSGLSLLASHNLTPNRTLIIELLK